MSGKLDFAVTPITIENSEIEQIKLMDEDIFIVVSQDHPLAKEKYIRLYDLKDDYFVVDEASFDQKIVRVLCGIAGFEPKILLHSNEGDLIDDALRSNLGVALVPANLILPQKYEPSGSPCGQRMWSWFVCCPLPNAGIGFSRPIPRGFITIPFTILKTWGRSSTNTLASSCRNSRMWQRNGWASII